MSSRTFEPLSEAERLWLQHQLAEAATFANFKGEPDEIPLEALDDAFEAFINLGEAANSQANNVVLALGAALGQHLVRTMGFEWCIATDDWGTDIAVVAHRGQGDVTIFPTNFVAKRWESKEPRFLMASLGPISQTLRDSAAAWRDA